MVVLGLRFKKLTGLKKIQAYLHLDSDFPLWKMERYERKETWPTTCEINILFME